MPERRLPHDPRPDLLALLEPESRRHPLPLIVRVLLVVGLISMGVVFLIGPKKSPSPTAYHVRCEVNLRLIGQALYRYAGANGGQFPDSLATLFDADASLHARDFVCRASGQDAADGGSALAERQRFRANPAAHCSYVYTGAALTRVTAGRAHVLAHEPLTDHGDGAVGAHVLMGDTRVEWLDAPAARRLIDELTAGHNPPRSPPAATAPAPP